MRAQLSAFALTLPLVAVAQQAAWAQCGGNGWSGGKSCVSGYTCSAQNDYYSQCIPSTSGSTSGNSNGNNGNNNENGNNNDNSNTDEGDDDAITTSIPVSKPTTRQQQPPQQQPTTKRTTSQRTTSQRTTQQPKPTTTSKTPIQATQDAPKTTITTQPDPVISTISTRKVSTVTSRRTITRSTISTQQPSQPTQNPSQGDDSSSQPPPSSGDQGSSSNPGSSGGDDEISTQPVGQQPNGGTSSGNGQNSGSTTTVSNGGSTISWEDAFPSGGSSGSITSTWGKRATQAGPGTSLQSGYYWIRAVAAPNYHKYLQTKPTYTSGTALLESYTSAGQFKIESGQLMELISAPGATAEFLYAHVLPNTTVTQKLAMTFNETKSDYGTFAWSGDALTWTHPNVKRQNNAAWLVCGSQQLFINTGAYNYQTPSGCSDQTIHYYNDKTANN